MKKNTLSILSSAILSVMLALAVLPSIPAKAAGEVITSTAIGGAWNDTSTWVGGVVPDGVDDSVVIATTGGLGVALNGAISVKGSLTINSDAEFTTNNYALTLEGDFVNNGDFEAGSSNITIAGTAPTQNIAGFFTSGNVSMTKTAGVATFTGNVNGAGLTLNGLGGTLNLGVGNLHTFTGAWTRTNGALEGGSSTLKLYGTVTGSSGTFTPGTSNFYYMGTTQNIAGITYYRLRMQGNGTKTALGNITVNENMIILSGSNFLVGAFDITVMGTTSVTGTLTHNHPDGTKIYNGLVTINPGGVWNNSTGNANIRFHGGLTHNGATFNAGAGTYLFETNNQAIGGSSALTIPSIMVEATRTLTNNNSGGLSVTTSLAGEALTQGASGVLNLGMADSGFTLTTLNASAIGNTVNYSFGGLQTVKDIAYHNLSLSTSGAKTLPVGLTHLTGNLSLSGTATAQTAADLDIDGNLSITNGATLTVDAFNFNVDGTTTITGTSASVNGKLSFFSVTGTKSFIGLVTVGTNGIWDNAIGASVTLEGGLTFSGKTFTSGNGLYTFQTTASQAVDGTAALSISNLAVGAGVNLTNNNSVGLSVTNTLSGLGTLTQGAGGILNIGALVENFTLSTLDASASGNTVNYNGSSQTVRPVTYHNLTLSGSSAKVISGLATVNGNLTFSGTASASTDVALAIGGNLTVGSGTSFTVGAFDISVAGTTAIGGTLFHTSATGTKLYVGLVTITGTWSNTGNANITFRGGLNGDMTAIEAGTGVYTFDTTATQTIASGSSLIFEYLTVGSGVTLTNSGTVTVFTELNGAGTWAQGATGVLSIGGSSGIATLTASAVGNTVKYNGTSPQTVIGIPYHHLELSGGSAKTLPAGLTTVNGNLTLATSGTVVTLAADLTVGGNITIGANSTLDVSASSHAVNVVGNWTCSSVNGAFTSYSGTVTLQGSAQQTVNNGDCFFNNLTLNNAAGAALSSTNTTVNGMLTLTSGMVTTNTRTLIIGSGGSISGASATNYVFGNLQKVFATSGSPQSFTFAIGDATNYTPIDLTIASVDTTGSITAKTAAGEHPNIATIVGLNQYKDVNRYWTLTPATIVFSTYDATFNFAAGDLDAGANTSIFVAKRYDSSPAGWNPTTVGTRTATSTQAVDIPYTSSSNVYSFAVGEGDDAAPTVTDVTASTPNGSYNASDVISGITVKFSEVVDVTGTPQLTLETGATDAVLDYVSGTGTDTLTFSDYTVQAADASSDLDAASLDLNGGTIEDASNNAATLTLAGTPLATNKDIVIDNAPPETQIDSAPASLTNSVSAAFTYSADETSTFECQLDAGGYGACASPYTVTEGLHTFFVRATDLAGNVDPTPDSHAWTVDTTGPTVVSSVRVHATPTAQNAVKFTVTFSEPVTGVDTADFSLTVSKVTGASVTAVTGSGTTYTVTVNTGSGNGTIKLNVLDNDSILDAALNPQNGAFTSGQVYTINKTLTYKSIYNRDGWVLESTATSNAGGTINSVATTFNLGDDASKKQYRAILHFNTASLPNNAVITSVTLKFLKASGGSGNTSTLGALLADMRKAYFGSSATLQTTDFQATAGKSSIFNAFTISSNWYSAAMKSAGYTYVNRLGTTQFRLRFTKGDDGDGTADYLKFYSGNASSASRPQLIIQYYVPMP